MQKPIPDNDPAATSVRPTGSQPPYRRSPPFLVPAAGRSPSSMAIRYGRYLGPRTR